MAGFDRAPDHEPITKIRAPEFDADARADVSQLPVLAALVRRYIIVTNQAGAERNSSMKKLAVLALIIITAICPPCFSGDRPATVLIVTADALAESWKPFAQWKTRLRTYTGIDLLQLGMRTDE